MERISFNHRGIIFEAEGYVENPADPWFTIEAVYHQCIDMTEIFEDEQIVSMEESLNKQALEEERAERAMLKQE